MSPDDLQELKAIIAELTVGIKNGVYQALKQRDEERDQFVTAEAIPLRFDYEKAFGDPMRYSLEKGASVREEIKPAEVTGEREVWAQVYAASVAASVLTQKGSGEIMATKLDNAANWADLAVKAFRERYK